MRTTDDPASDRRLVQSFADHANQHVMEVLFRRHLPRVYSLARRYFVVREDAEEAASETFVRVFRALRSGQFRGESSFATWTLRIAANVCLERLRQPRLPTLSLDDLGEISAPYHQDQTGVYEALALLPDPYRLILTLCDIEGSSAAEASEILGRSITATKSIHYRARRALRDVLEKYDNPLS
jgi:RNA polymerase sigma-70 factor (ECF subfamily)